MFSCRQFGATIRSHNQEHLVDTLGYSGRGLVILNASRTYQAPATENQQTSKYYDGNRYRWQKPATQLFSAQKSLWILAVRHTIGANHHINGALTIILSCIAAFAFRASLEARIRSRWGRGRTLCSQYWKHTPPADRDHKIPICHPGCSCSRPSTLLQDIAPWHVLVSQRLIKKSKMFPHVPTGPLYSRTLLRCSDVVWPVSEVGPPFARPFSFFYTPQTQTIRTHEQHDNGLGTRSLAGVRCRP